jgi:ATP:ADP antiporter, AAA family
LMLLADCIGTVLYALMLDIARANYATPEARTAFFANVDFATNLLQIVCQVSLTRWVLTRHGPRPALVGSALFNLVVLTALAFTAHPVAVAVAIVITRAGAYGVVQPARESLFTRVDREARYKAKNFIDTVVWRGGDIGVTVGLSALKQVGMAIPGFALLCAAAAAGSAWLGYILPGSPGLTPETPETRDG